jgi:hypothetical protein
MSAELIPGDSYLPPFIYEIGHAQAEIILIGKCPNCPFGGVICSQMNRRSGIATFVSPITDAQIKDIKKSAPCLTS